MEAILAYKKRNSQNSPTKIKELLTQISNVHFEDDKIVHKLKEYDSRMIEFSKEVSILKEELAVEEQNLKRKEADSQERCRILQDLKDDKLRLSSTLTDLEQKHKALKLTKPSARDEILLTTGKRRLQLYKEFTNVRWDYAVLPAIEGHVTNKTNFLEKFACKEDENYKTIRESLWKVIERSAMDNSKRDECKENKPFNK